MRAAVDHLVRAGQLLAWGIPAPGVLVETLLERGADDDVAEAEAAIERLAAAPTDEGLVLRDRFDHLRRKHERRRRRQKRSGRVG